VKSRCDFCYHHCTLDEGQSGICSVRTLEQGRIVTKAYGHLAALAVDPVEKKPLYHFLPGSKTLSLAMPGCNLACDFCQNYTISQSPYHQHQAGEAIDTAALVSLAVERNCPSISFTYSEPLVWQDYMLEVASLAKSKGLSTIMVTNGTFSEEALERIFPLIDAYNIDLKGDESFYRRRCSGSAKPVLDAIEYLVGKKAHVEVTTMVMESEHDGAHIRALAGQLAGRGVQVWHLSRYFPHYLATDPATSESYLQQMINTVSSFGIDYVYAGNSEQKQATFCPRCHAQVVSDRRHAPIRYDKTLKEGRCSACNQEIYGRWPS